MEMPPLSDDHVQEILNARKLWSVHLHTLGPQIQQMVRLLCCCGPQLLQLLRKVCVQISDLSASTALVVARAALDAVLSSCLAGQDPAPSSSSTAKVEESDKDGPPASLPAALIGSAHLARVLNFLAAVVTHPPVKAAALQLCRGLQKSDEKYADLLPCLCLVLNSVSTTPAHVQSQECVVSIFQALLDADICLLTAADVDETAYLSAALPAREPIVTIITGLWDHLANAEHNYSSLLPALRTLTLLTERNYTFQHLHRVLERKRHALWAFFDKMAAGFNKDSSDCLSTLSTALELMRTLVKVVAAPRHQRSATVPVATLSEALRWRTSSSTTAPIDEDNSEVRHPLLALQDFLRHSCTEEESMDSLRDNVSALIDILQSESTDSSADSSAVRKDVVETVIPMAEPLSLLFTRRPIVSDSTADEDRLMSSYWLSSHHHHHTHWTAEEPESETDHVRCDLLEMAQSCLAADVDLVAMTERLCKSHTEPTEILGRAAAASSAAAITATATTSNSTLLSIKGRGVNSTRSAETLAHGRPILSTARDHSSSRPYVAPMRGRGFGRPGGVNGRNDPFRSRAPNTSRPPSLHVDDFVALEKNGGAVGGASSSTGVGNNVYAGGKTQRGGARVGGGGGNRIGRGGNFSSSDRGRFSFQQPPRREALRSRPGGAGGGGSTSSASGGPAKWGDDPYLHSQSSSSSSSSSLAETRSASGRFPSANRVWTNNAATKERYTSASSAASSANRSRHTRTFSR